MWVWVCLKLICLCMRKHQCMYMCRPVYVWIWIFMYVHTYVKIMPRMHLMTMYSAVRILLLSSSSSSAFDMMVVLTRSSLPWVPRTWMSGTDPLQTPRAWFWGTHKWAISAAMLAGGVSRTTGNVLVFGPPLYRGIERRSLRQSSWHGYSVCSGLFWGERWWSTGVVAADGACPGLGCS